MNENEDENEHKTGLNSFSPFVAVFPFMQIR